MKPRLRHLLAAAFMFIATVPLLILGFWVKETAMDKELAAVQEKHLLVARNLTGALERYAVDAKVVFSFLVDTANRKEPGGKEPDAAVIKLGKNIGFRHFCIIGDDGRVIEQLPFDGVSRKRLAPEVMERLRPYLGDSEVTFSDVIADAKGTPTIYLTRKLASGNTAVAALGLDYIRKVQKAIQFGRKGHSAIVDRTGALLAHPITQWADEMRNISKLTPVKKMMAGETGVTTFYSPAMKKDMISGFTTVPSTGWGVMVPQPLEELEERASDVNRIALMLILIGLLVAGLISWMLSGLLVRPVEGVVLAARKIQDGYLEARVPRQSTYSPIEFHELGDSFNSMARDIATVMMQRERVEGELREAHDDLEERVQARTRELTEEITERKEAEKKLRLGEGRFRGAIESMQEGFALFDADDRLVAVNDEYLRVSPGAQKVLDEGGTFEDVIRANVATGLIVEAQGREEKFIQERIDLHQNPKGPIIRKFVDGSWFMIVEVRTPEGGIALSFIDVTELKQAEEALDSSRKRFKDFAEVASDWFWEMDADLRFSYFSGRNFQVTGYKPSDLVGKSRREMTKEKGQDEKWRRHLDDIDAHRPFHDFCYALAKSDGSEIHISISGMPLFDDEGNFVGYRGTGTDVTAHVLAEAALRVAKEEAEFANRAKTEFLTNMSHELRTPLNSVIGFSDILMTDTFDIVENPKVLEYMEDINNSGKHLLELINDILDVARIERGMMDLNEKKLDVPLLLASCQRLVIDRAFEAGVKIESNISETLPALLADELRTKQIMLNLLSNAIKFTPEGGTISLKADIDAENRFQLSVNDTGIGIAKENIPIALSEFGQVDGSFTRKYDGTGLGLPLSQKLMELHGGELSIESEPGVGTTVTICFPSERTITLSA